MASISEILRKIEGTLVEREFPRQITLELAAACNLRCIMCPHPSMTRQKGVMGDDLYRKCIDEVASRFRDTEVWLADHGESLLLGEAIVEKTRHAKDRGLPRVFLNSNGMLLTRGISRGLVEAGLDAIYFGIDASEPATYRRIRVGGDLETLKGNIDALIEERERAGSTKPEIWVQFIEMDENRGEREAFHRFWRRKKVGVKIRKKLSWGASIRSPAIEGLDERRIACPWIVNLMHVLWDGRVCRCSGDHECNHPMGDVRRSSIAEIWQGPLKAEREVHLRRDFEALGDQCRRCVDWKVGAAEKYHAELEAEEAAGEAR